MSKSVKVNDLQVGMKVTADVLGKRGDVKVSQGEILSNLHVTKMKSWKGLDEANPKGIKVESSPLHSGDEFPRTVMHPWESPVIQAHSKNKLQSTISVPAILDETGKCLNPNPLERELTKRDNNANIETQFKRGRGRPKKS